MAEAKLWIADLWGVDVAKSQVDPNGHVLCRRRGVKRLAIGEHERGKADSPLDGVASPCTGGPRPGRGGALEDPCLDPTSVRLPCSTVVTPGLALHQPANTVAAKPRLDCVGDHLPLRAISSHPTLVVDAWHVHQRVDQNLHFVTIPRPPRPVQKVGVGVARWLPARCVCAVRDVIINIDANVQVGSVKFQPTLLKVPVDGIGDGKELLNRGRGHGENRERIAPFPRLEYAVDPWGAPAGRPKRRPREQWAHGRGGADWPRPGHQLVHVVGIYMLRLEALAARHRVPVEIGWLPAEAGATRRWRPHGAAPGAHPAGQSVEPVGLVKHRVVRTGEVHDAVVQSKPRRRVADQLDHQVCHGRRRKDGGDRVERDRAVGGIGAGCVGGAECRCHEDGQSSTEAVSGEGPLLHPGVAGTCRRRKLDRAIKVRQSLGGKGSALGGELRRQLAAKEQRVGAAVGPARRVRRIEVGAAKGHDSPRGGAERNRVHPPANGVSGYRVSLPSRDGAVYGRRVEV
mmetsp:Transcript_3579/g.8841  ORF Transcript_3579/g.8841 Transcript_3579/m.8841 type:complete len:514 (-) Transcript_3579:253-1794(-)